MGNDDTAKTTSPTPPPNPTPSQPAPQSGDGLDSGGIYKPDDRIIMPVVRGGGAPAEEDQPAEPGAADSTAGTAPASTESTDAGDADADAAAGEPDQSDGDDSTQQG